VVVLLVGAGLLALAETALSRTSRAKALSLRDEHRRGSGRLVRLVENPQAFLNPILLLVLICQLVTATLVGILAERFFGVWGVLAATFFEVVVIFVLAEALPKNWAVFNPERSALFVAPIVSALVGFPPVRMLSRGLIGLANLLMRSHGREVGGMRESELLAMADVAMEEEVIETQERELIHSIIGFGDTIVREVMVPRPDMRTMEADQPVSRALDVAIAAGFSRLPVHEGNLDDVVGIAFTKDLIRAEREGHGDRPVRDFARPPHFVPETKRVSRLMREMQERQFHQAVVVDEYGGTAGLVTLEDLIEELVGEIVDEYDVEEPPVVTLDSGEVSVTARLAVDELNELLDTELPEGDWDTVGGLLFNVLGRVPVEGESAEVDGMRLVAERVQGNRIGRVRISPLHPPGPAPPAAPVGAPGSPGAPGSDAGAGADGGAGPAGAKRSAGPAGSDRARAHDRD
jgi:CBS domain containing-hemolysin-like protein